MYPHLRTSPHSGIRGDISRRYTNVAQWISHQRESARCVCDGSESTSKWARSGLRRAWARGNVVHAGWRVGGGGGARREERVNDIVFEYSRPPCQDHVRLALPLTDTCICSELRSRISTSSN